MTEYPVLMAYDVGISASSIREALAARVKGVPRPTVMGMLHGESNVDDTIPEVSAPDVEVVYRVESDGAATVPMVVIDGEKHRLGDAGGAP